MNQTLVTALAFALLLVAALPLVLAWYLLHGLRTAGDDDVSEVLVRELVSNQSNLLTTERRQAIEHTPSADDEEPPFQMLTSRESPQ